MATYFLKKKSLKMGNHKLDVKISKCKEFDDYDKLEKLIEGTLYYSGKKIDLKEFVNSGNIVEIVSKEDEAAQNFSLDLVEF